MLVIPQSKEIHRRGTQLSIGISEGCVGPYISKTSSIRRRLSSLQVFLQGTEANEWLPKQYGYFNKKLIRYLKWLKKCTYSFFLIYKLFCAILTGLSAWILAPLPGSLSMPFCVQSGSRWSGEIWLWVYNLLLGFVRWSGQLNIRQGTEQQTPSAPWWKSIHVGLKAAWLRLVLL